MTHFSGQGVQIVLCQNSAIFKVCPQLSCGTKMHDKSGYLSLYHPVIFRLKTKATTLNTSFVFHYPQGDV